MFTSQKNHQGATKGKSSLTSSAVTILTNGCHFNGKLYCRGSSRIGGRIEGQIVSEGLLIVEEEATITAEIKAEEVVIQGKVQGKLTASSRVELCASCQFDGDITTPVLIVREGAHFNGHATMPPKEANDSKSKHRVIGGSKSTPKESAMPEIEKDMKLDVKLKAPEIHVRPG